MASDKEIELFQAICNNDLNTVKEVIESGIDPKDAQFVIRKYSYTHNLRFFTFSCVIVIEIFPRKSVYRISGCTARGNMGKIGFPGGSEK